MNNVYSLIHCNIVEAASGGTRSVKLGSDLPQIKCEEKRFTNFLGSIILCV